MSYNFWLNNIFCSTIFLFFDSRPHHRRTQPRVEELRGTPHAGQGENAAQGEDSGLVKEVQALGQTGTSCRVAQILLSLALGLMTGGSSLHLLLTDIGGGHMLQLGLLCLKTSYACVLSLHVAIASACMVSLSFWL